MESDTVLELLTEKVDPPLASVTASASPVDILDLSSPTAYDEKSQCSSRAPFENPEGTVGGLTVTDSPELEAEVEPEVELEADAESLTSSSDSEDGSEDNVQELTYFRFTRCGLSITVDLSVSARTPQFSAAEADVDMSATRDDSTLPIRPVKKEGSEQQNMEQPQDEASERVSPVIWNGSCAAVNFEAACLEKYPACYPIGYRVGRFSKLQNTPLFPSTTSGVSVSSSGVQALTSTTCSAPPSVSAARVAPPCNAEQTPTLSAGAAVAPKPPSPGWLSAVESVAPGAPRPSAPTPRTEDRLSTVIQDILHRLNRQGTLADPRDLCRKGGGRSGQYYDKDDQFFDDSLTYEHLGLSSSFSSEHSPYSGGRRHRSSTSKLANEAHNNPCAFEDTLNDSFDDLSASGRGDDDDDDDEPIVYDYTDLTTFTCDNIPENDQLILLDDSAFVDEEQNDSASSSSVSDGVSATEDDDDDGVGRDRDASATSLNEKKGPVLVTTKHWIRRKAWREMESKLRPDLVEALTKLEHALRGKGTRKGLYVQPVDVARVCRETVREIFVKEYPKVAWNSSSFLASSYPEPTSLSSAMPRDLSHPNVPPAAKDLSLKKTESLKTELQKPAKTVTALEPHVSKLGNSSTSGGLPPAQCPTVVDLTMDDDVVGCQHEMVVKAADRPQQLSDFVDSGLPATNCCTAFPLQSSPPSFPMCFEPVLEIDLADDCSGTTPTLAKSKEPDVSAPSLDAPPSTDLAGSRNLTVAARLSDAPPSVDAVSDSKPVKCSTSGEGNNPSNEKKPRRQTLPPPSFQNTAATNDLVSLATCPALKQLGLCLMKMTNTVTPDLLKRWLMMRLVLHNQVIYSVLEERLFSFIVKKSSLFRTRGSYFFRSLKKAVDNYLKSLASSTNGAKTTPAAPQGRGATPVTPNDAGVTTPSLGQQEKQIAPLERKAGTHSAMTTPGGNDGPNANMVPAQASLGTTSGAVPIVAQQEAANNATLGPPPDSPFAPVAKELLNWAVVYNCRRHELKELGETLDEWAAGFSAYAVEILNQSIQKRRRTGGSASGSLGTQQGGNAAASKKNRVWVPIKFLEETLMRFKEYYGVLTLYERRSRKPVIPQFITPCKGLHPPAVRAFRQHQNQTRGSAKQAPLVVDANKQQVPPEPATLKQSATKDVSSSAVKKTPPLDSLVVTPPSNDGVLENNVGVAQVPLKKRRRKEAAMGVPTRDGDTENNVAVQKKRKKPQQLLRTNGVSADGPKSSQQEDHQHNPSVPVLQPSSFPATKERSTVDDVVSSQPKPITINDYFLKIQKRDDASKTQQPGARANVTTVQRLTAADDLAPKLTELSVSVLPESETHQDALPCQPSCARTPPVGIGVESTYKVRSPQRVVTSPVVPVVSSTKALQSSATVSPGEKYDTSHIFQKSGLTQQGANAIAIPQNVNSYLSNAPEQLHDNKLPLSSCTQSADTRNSNANVPFSCQAPPLTAQDKLVSQCPTTSPNNYRQQNDESYLHNPFMVAPSTNVVSQQPDMRALSSALREGMWPVQQQPFSASNLVTTTSSLPFPYMDTSNASGLRIPSATLPEPQLPYTTDQHQTQRQLAFHQMALSWRPPLQVPLPTSGLLTSSPLCSFPPNFLFMPTAASNKNFFYQTPVPATSEQAHHARWDTAATVPLMGICASSSLSSMDTSTNAPTPSHSGTTASTPPALPHDNSSNARRSL